MSKDALQRAFIAGMEYAQAGEFPISAQAPDFETWYESECASMQASYDPAKDYTNPAFAGDKLVTIELNDIGKFVAVTRGMALPYEISEDSGLFTVRAPDDSRICTRLWREPAEDAIARYWRRDK